MQLTTSEARAEAASIILHVLLSRLSGKALARLYDQARAEAELIGHSPIEDEVAWICRDARAATAALLAFDECD